MSPRDGRRVFATFLIGILLVQAAWILALPAFRGIDEFDHVYKAAAVARGEWTSYGQAKHGRGGLVRIPGDIVSAASPVCRSYSYTRPDDCVPVRRYPGGDVEIASAASAYNPAYYLAVGTLVRPFHGDAVDYAMRGITAVSCALLLAWAATLVAGWGRTRWPLVFFTLGLTPVLVYSTAIASPNGVAYSGAALLWSAMLSVVRRQQGTVNEAVAAGVGAAALVTAHGTGPMLAFLVLVIVLAMQHPGVWWRATAGHRATWTGTAVAVLLVALGSVAWIAHAHPAGIGEPADAPLTLADQLTFQALWPLESIAVFPTVTEYAPAAVYVLCGLPLLGMLLVVLRKSRGRTLLALLGVVILLVVIPAAYTAATYAEIGLVWQGRYSLPLWLGLSAIASLVASTRREALAVLVPVVYAMAAAAVMISVVHVARVEVRSGVTEPIAGHIPGGLALVAVLSLAGTLLPLTLRRDSLGPALAEEERGTELEGADRSTTAR